MAFKSDLDALILGVLQDGPLHGYEISKRIKERSSDLLTIGEGRLYPALHQLEQQDMVHALWIPQESKPPRKVYELTESGRAELAEKKNAWSKFADGINTILLAPKTEGGHG